MENTFEKGAELFYAGKMEEAIIIFEELIKKQPLAFPPHYMKGLYHWHKKEYQQSIDAFKMALAIQPGDADILFQIANNYYKIEDYKIASYYYKEAEGFGIEKDTSLATQCYYNWGKCILDYAEFLYELDEDDEGYQEDFDSREFHEQALTCFQKSRILNSGALHCIYEIANLNFFYLNNRLAAKEDYELMVDKTPQEHNIPFKSNSLRNLAIITAMEKEFDKSLQYIKESIEIDDLMRYSYDVDIYLLDIRNENKDFDEQVKALIAE